MSSENKYSIKTEFILKSGRVVEHYSELSNEGGVKSWIKICENYLSSKIDNIINIDNPKIARIKCFDLAGVEFTVEELAAKKSE